MKFEDVFIQSEAGYAHAKKFNTEAHVPETVFNSNLDEFEVDKIWRITICFTTNKELDNYIEDLVDVITVYHYFDFENYWSKEASERKKLLLDSVISSIDKIADKYNLPLEVFHDAYKKTIKQEIKYAGFWNDPQKSKDGRYEGRIYLELDIGVSKMEAEIKDLQTNKISRYLLCNPKPHFMFFDRLLGKAFWNSNGEYCLKSKDGKTVLKAYPNLSNQKIMTDKEGYQVLYYFLEKWYRILSRLNP